MFRNITIGQYYPVSSIFHRLDPRTKIAGVVVYVAALFVINRIWGLIPELVVLGLLIGISKVPLKHMLKGLRGILYIMILAVFFHVMFTKGDVLWQWWIFTVSTEGIRNAVFFTARTVYAILGASLLTYTTTPTALTDGLEKIFSHLEFMKFPAHDIAMMMSIALRFIPILAEEVNKIIRAQLARGADFDSGGLIRKLKGTIPILIPLFVSAFRRASNLADAMEARCYRGGKGRTRLHPLKYHGRDCAAYIVITVYLLAVIGLRIWLGKYSVPWRIG